MTIITKGILMLVLGTFIYWGLDKLAKEYLRIKIYEVASWIVFIILLTIAVIFTSQNYTDAFTVFALIMMVGVIFSRVFDKLFK